MFAEGGEDIWDFRGFVVGEVGVVDVVFSDVCQ